METVNYMTTQKVRLRFDCLHVSEAKSVYLMMMMMMMMMMTMMMTTTTTMIMMRVL